MIARFRSRIRNSLQHRGLSTLLVITFLASSSPLAARRRQCTRPSRLPTWSLPFPRLCRTRRQTEATPYSQMTTRHGATSARFWDEQWMGRLEQPLAGVQVVAVGVLGLRALPIDPPIQLAGIAHASGHDSVVIPNAGLTPLTETVIFTATTNATGDYLFDVPAGDYTLTYTLAGYTPDGENGPVQANEVLRVDDVRLHPQDPVVTELDSSGGTAVNSAGNSNVQFPPGAACLQKKMYA